MGGWWVVEEDDTGELSIDNIMSLNATAVVISSDVQLVGSRRLLYSCLCGCNYVFI